MPVLDISTVSGLRGSDAETKLREEGYNELPAADRRGLTHIILEVIHEPMFLLLVASGLIYFILGDVTEGLMLMSFVVAHHRHYRLPGAEDRAGARSAPEPLQPPGPCHPGRGTDNGFPGGKS